MATKECTDINHSTRGLTKGNTVKTANFNMINWNIGGAKFLAENAANRAITKRKMNKSLKDLIINYDFPHVITLQEIVQYAEPKKKLTDIVGKINGYKYWPFPLIDSNNLSARDKWDKVEKDGKWLPGTYFAQGNGFLFREDLPHFPVWDLSASKIFAPKNTRHFIEQVTFGSGLYFGDRNTEPRAALVAHFIFNPIDPKRKPLDIFVVNIHLTTLKMERDGIPELDKDARLIRLGQLNTIFYGIVSRYNAWRQKGYLVRDEPRTFNNQETSDRLDPVWIIAGDFNFTEESVEYDIVQKMNFIDIVEKKERGTKASGVGGKATITLDFIFAGPKFISFDPFVTSKNTEENKVTYEVTESDHYPLIAKIPISITISGEGKSEDE